MRVFLTLLRRELGSYFVSFTGYIIIALALLTMGLSLAGIVGAAKGTPLPMSLTELFFITPYFWIIQLLTAPFKCWIAGKE